jgi:hypothetical protein
MKFLRMTPRMVPLKNETGNERESRTRDVRNAARSHVQYGNG